MITITITIPSGERAVRAERDRPAAAWGLLSRVGILYIYTYTYIHI